MNHESSQCLTSFYHGMTIFVIRSRKMKPYFKLHFSQPAYGKNIISKLLKPLIKAAFKICPASMIKLKKKMLLTQPIHYISRFT